MPSASSQPPASSIPDESAFSLIRQIERSIDGHRASGEAFVASVYGEWGVGKTYCLRAIYGHYERRIRERLETTQQHLPARDDDEPLVVPVWFDPWRFAHEEHLVVPLLKTIEHQLLAMEQRIADATPIPKRIDVPEDEFIARNRRLGQAVQRGAVTVARFSQAMLSAIKFKIAPFGVGVDVDPKAAIEMSQKLAKEQSAPAAPTTPPTTPLATPPTARADGDWLRARESLYFDAQSHLEALTTSSTTDAHPLRLVVLVDDLDRCLPEAAIQVLESIKLFLNVKGFCFVLAVDDEVIERGIAHRYREYRLSDADGRFVGDMPISGTQYLEKIVHLPVQLPRWTRLRAERFLVENYPALYSPLPASAAEERKTLGGDDMDPPAGQAPTAGGGVARGHARDDSRAALELVLAAVPLVPRKLVRLSEGVMHLRETMSAIGAGAYWSLRHAIRVVALQQLYPRLYRYVRQHDIAYARMFEIRRDSVMHEAQLPDGRGTMRGHAELKHAHAQWFLAAQGAERTGPTFDTEQLKRKLELLDRIETCLTERGAADPLALFDVDDAGAWLDGTGLERRKDSFDAFRLLYLYGEAPATEARVGPDMLAGDDPPEAEVHNAASAVDALASLDDLARRRAIEGLGLEGTRLPEDVLDRVMDAVSAQNAGRDHATSKAWLTDMSKLTSRDQFVRIYLKLDVLKHASGFLASTADHPAGKAS